MIYCLSVTTAYEDIYERSLRDPSGFWSAAAQEIEWVRRPRAVLDDSKPPRVRWFPGAMLNTCYNAVDLHVVAGRGEQTALIYDSPVTETIRTFSYRELQDDVCKFANSLKKLGAKKGDRITIYMPMIPEAAVAMLACARIGAVHSVVFGGFSPEALAGRIHDCESNIVITADQGLRGGKAIPLKANVDAAAGHPDVSTLEKVLVVKRTGAGIDWTEGRDAWLHELEATVDADCPCEEMGAEDPLFILYTSGSTGKPKGVLHTTGGYLVYAALTHQYVFDYKPGDVYWCTADVGW
ncbi:MAG: AMP-binding protein, partial [Gammaproteobacteria bacterium]|nr:AMP-binding protein [Gammaproteobacteria bacterium]